MMDAPIPQFLAHDTGQGTAVGLGDVSQTELGGVQFVAGAQGHDEGNIQPPGGLRQVQLAGDQIDGVHDVVVAAASGEKVIPMSGVIGGLHGVQDRVRVDIPDAGGHSLRLGQSHCGVQRLQLAVDIGDGDCVAVHQR